MRQFVVTRAQLTGQKGKNTSFPKNKTYAGKSPVSAAGKAFTDLCKIHPKKREVSKRIRGRCSMNVTVKEIKATPSGAPSVSKGKVIPLDTDKQHTYRMKRRKVNKLVPRGNKMVSYGYETKVISLSKKGANKSLRIRF